MNVRIKLTGKWIKYLIHQPESGMGYQRVDVILEDGTKLENCLVFNAEEIELPAIHAQKRIKEMCLSTIKK